MPRIALKVISENEMPEVNYTIQQKMATDIIGPDENSSLSCGNCDRTLVHGFSLDTFHSDCVMGFKRSKKYAVFECPQCNSLNTTET